MVFLEVQDGRTPGKRYELVLRSYRAVGRSDGGKVTVQLTSTGDHSLEPKEIARVEEHLERRSSSVETPAPVEQMRIGSFRRGRDILVEDDKVSRTHAMVFVDEEGPSVVDLLSTNGTLVNGVKVGDAELSDGDILDLGRTRFVVRVSP